MSEKTSTGRKNWKNKGFQKQAEDKKVELATTLAQNEVRSEQAKIEHNKPSNQTKITSTINKGATSLAKFFNGFSSVNHRNIMVELDTEFLPRVVDQYDYSIEQHHKREETKSKKTIEASKQQFHGAAAAGVALKLHQSSTKDDKNANSSLPVLDNSEILLPKKMNVIINQLGKTDLKDDNKIGIHNQHVLSKRFLFEAVIRYYRDEASEYFQEGAKNITITNVLKLLSDQDIVWIDDTKRSRKESKRIGRLYFERNRLKGFKFKITDKDYIFSIPPFFSKDPDEKITLDHVINYFNNPIFTDFTWQEKDLIKLISSLVVQVATSNWYEKPGSKMSELDDKFSMSWLKDLKFFDILTELNIISVNWFFKDKDLNELAGDMIQQWNTSDSVLHRHLFNMDKLKFSEFGTEAQLIEVDHWKSLSEAKAWKIRGRPKSHTSLKTQEHSAIMGLAVKFVRKVSFISDFEINHSKENKEILSEIIASDFR